MFESSLVEKLRDDAELVSYVSTYELSSKTIPSIFAGKAPKKVDFNYITCRISRTDSGYAALATFNIFIDFFGYELSSSTAKKAAIRLEDLLDSSHLTHPEFNLIRLKLEAGDFMEISDVKAQHYNLRFTARAARSGWMGRL